MLRITHISSGDLWAGAEAQLFHLLRALKARNEIEISVALFNPGELERRLSDLGIQVQVLDESKLKGLALLRSLTRELRCRQPTIVHTHGFKENVFGSCAALLTRTPYCVRTVHGASEISPALWQVKKHAAHALDSFVGRKLQDGAAIVSEGLATQLRERKAYSSIWTIKNGVDVEELREQAHYGSRLPQSDRMRVGIVARLFPVKRVDLFLRAAEVLLRKGQPYEFLVIGDGPLRPSLEKMAQELRVQDRVSFLGFRSDAISLMSQLDAVVFTSDHEGMPMVALESLALGVPVVARAVGGLTEVLGNPDQGALVASDSPETLALALAEVLERSTRRTRESLLPLEYHISHTAERYLELYNTLASR